MISNYANNHPANELFRNFTMDDNSGLLSRISSQKRAPQTFKFSLPTWTNSLPGGVNEFFDQFRFILVMTRTRSHRQNHSLGGLVWLIVRLWRCL